MELSLEQKLILANQYEILKRVDPAQEQHYGLLLTCLYEGYYQDFENLIPHFDQPLKEEVRKEVRDILEMFRALYPPQYHAAKITPPAIFAGFDGNEESAHYSYARFLLEERDLWRESKTGDYNTHSNVLADYRKMLEEWEISKDKFRLTEDDISRIVAVAPYLSTQHVQSEERED